MSMDIEELNTTQIILLVLLVSFVTSIATGIVTVSLLAQAPPAVTQTVNRVVERTVETIVPKDLDSKTQSTKETTVVVKEDDLITSSIADSLGKTGRVYGDTSTTSPVIALAAQISPGSIVTDANVGGTDHLVSFGDTTAVFTVSETFPEIGVAILTPKSASTTLGTPFQVANTAAVKLGQTTIALISVTSARVAIGAVAAIAPLADAAIKGEDAYAIRSIDTNISASPVPGTPLVSIFGDLVGIYSSVSQASGKGSFVSASDIVGLLKATRAAAATAAAAPPAAH